MDHQRVTHTVTDRYLGRRPSGMGFTVPVHRYEGGSGPTVYVQAAQHGIERNGPAALRRLHERLVGADLAGTVIAVPVANPLAFDHRSYLTPPAYDGLNPNLNRVWPGDPDGTLQERLAARLWELAGAADVVVDLHTGTPDMLEHVRYRAGDTEARRLAAAFGTHHVLIDEADDDDATDGTLRAAASEAGIPAVTAELANSRQLSRSAIETGVDGVENILRERGLLTGSPPTDAERLYLQDIPDDVEAGESGMFEVRAGLGVGDRLEAGAELGAVYCPSSYERLETVTLVDGGVLYSLSRTGVVVAGERIASVGTPGSP